jgi:hypothetical protein
MAYRPAIAAKSEAASKVLPKLRSAKNSAATACFRIDFSQPIRFNEPKALLRAGLMKKLVILMLLVSSSAWAQTKLVPKSVTTRADNCAPIGRTAGGELVYSMKCENLPAPSPAPQAEVKEAPAPEPGVQRSGIFGWSYETKRPDQ